MSAHIDVNDDDATPAPVDTAHPVNAAPDASDALSTRLDAWRETGLDKRDPARFHRIEALSLRARAYTGDVRRVLDERLKALVDDFAKPVADAFTSPDTPAASTSPLAALTADITKRIGGMGAERPAASTSVRAARSTTLTSARNPGEPTKSDTPATVPARRAATPVTHAPVAITPTVIATDDAFEDLDVLEYFRETWSKLSTDGNLRQSLAQVPENAGPLNSSHLVHRALSLMHDVSPDYLRHFLRHADALSWLEDMETTGVFGNKAAARIATPAKPSRAKAR